MSLPTTEWVAQRKLGKKLYADAVSNRVEWLQRVANRKALASAYVQYEEQTDDKADEMGDYVLEEHFEDAPEDRRDWVLCAALGVAGVILIVLSFLR